MVAGAGEGESMSDTIPLPPKHYNLTAQLTYLCQHLKTHGYPDLVRVIMSKEKASRKGTGKRRNAEVAKDGKRVKGGKTKAINWGNPDIEYVESAQEGKMQF
jgi:hypothetical protein